MPYDFDLPHAAGTLANGAGVQPWSSPEQYVLFSIDRPDAGYLWSPSVTNADRFDEWLSGNAIQIGFKRLVGCYKGQQEPAWIINARDWRALAASGWIDGQESVLHLGAWENGGRPAHLYYSTRWTSFGPPIAGRSGTPEFLGAFKQATKAYALKQDAWTLDPTTHEYFVAE